MSIKIPGVFLTAAEGSDLAKHLKEMNTATTEWTMRAARGECGWICSDCCISFPEGMPDSCVHGHQKCTDVIQRDKQEANK